MRRLSVGLLVLMVVPGVLAQPHHENYETLTEDSQTIRATGDAIIARSVIALVAALADRPLLALESSNQTLALTEAMRLTVQANASSATSLEQLRPLTRSAGKLTGNVSSLITDWDAWRTMERAADVDGQARVTTRLLASALRDSLGSIDEGAAELRTIGHDTSELNATLQEFRQRLDASPLAALAPTDGPHLIVEIVPSRAWAGATVQVRGILIVPSPANASIEIALDGLPWLDLPTDPDGSFRTHHVMGEIRSGNHTATARTSAHDNLTTSTRFEVVPIPTTTTVTIPASRFQENATIRVDVRVTDALKLPVDGRVRLIVDGRLIHVLTTDENGGAYALLHGETLGRGNHTVEAIHLGDARRAPSSAITSFTVGPQLEEAEAEGGLVWAPLVPWAVLGTTLLVQALLLSTLHGVRQRIVRWTAPGILGAMSFLLAGASLIHIGAAVAASILVSVSRRPPRTAAGQPPPSSELKRPAPTDEDPPGNSADPRDIIARSYRSLLETVDRPGPMTHRDVARALKARGAPESAVETVTQMIEAALYSPRPPTATDATSFTQVVATLGVRT